MILRTICTRTTAAARLSSASARALAVAPRAFSSTPSPRSETTSQTPTPTALDSLPGNKIQIAGETIPESFLAAPLVPPTHGIPAAVLHLRSHHPDRLRIFLHFALHAANALDIPCTSPSHLPTKRTLITVPKSPFVHKSAQENFSESVHKRLVKVYDTDPLVVSRWVRYLQENALPGVALKVVRWERVGLGFGKELVEQAVGKKRAGAVASEVEEVKRLADEIVKREMEKVNAAGAAGDAGSPKTSAAGKEKKEPSEKKTSKPSPGRDSSKKPAKKP
ncbi:mitochondrial 37S ribosomal protein rsm10 [Tulasnella sp. 427]|nr:mitochondrial 37S ribosomal protein rsm10 [Tulasnella sp. 427]